MAREQLRFETTGGARIDHSLVREEPCFDGCCWYGKTSDMLSWNGPNLAQLSVPLKSSMLIALSRLTDSSLRRELHVQFARLTRKLIREAN
jgi:hypothetical protein